MAHDGQDLTLDGVILPDLLTLTGAAVAPVEAILETARDHVRDLVVADGRVSGALVEQNQFAAHGLAWLATYVEIVAADAALGRDTGRRRHLW